MSAYDLNQEKYDLLKSDSFFLHPFTNKVSETLGNYMLQVKQCPSTFTSDITITMKDSEVDKLLDLKEGDSVKYRAKMQRFGEILGLSANEGVLIN